MDRQNLLQDPNYDPAKFLSWATHEVFGVRNDAALSRKLDSSPPIISKIRNKKMAIGDWLLVKISDRTGLGTMEIRKQMFSDVAATEEQRAQSWAAMQTAVQP